MSVFAIVSTAAEAAGEVHDGTSSGGLPQLDMAWWPSQLFWLALTFGILYWLMAGRFLPAIGGAIEERRDRIADDLDQASDFKRQAEGAQDVYNKSLADAKSKAQGIAADTRAEVDAEIAEMQTETDASLQEQLEKAESRINTMKQEASAKVDAAASDATRAIVERLIDEAPTEDTVQRAVANVVR